MASFDHNKLFPRKKIYSTRDSPSSFGRGIYGNKPEGSSFSKLTKDISKEPLTINEVAPKKQPTILIKAREPTNEDGASPKRLQKDDVGTNITIVSSAKESEGAAAPTLKKMTKSLKFIDEGGICTETFHDYLQENNDFLVVGVVGAQGVGKSTILNMLCQSQVTEKIKRIIFKPVERDIDDEFGESVKVFSERLDKVDENKDAEMNMSEARCEFFKIETTEDIENNFNTTHGIDLFITPNRVIFLDCQPFMSVSVLEELVQSENKRPNLVSEFIPLENSGEIQSLQLTAFLMSVCHVLLVVQDWFFDSNIIRFIHSAEMLKPTISNPEDELTDNFPHLLLIHNKAQMEHFTPARFKIMQQTYKMLFQKTKLRVKSNLGIGSGRIINYLNKENCGSPINLFLIPEVDLDSNNIYNGYPPIEELIKRLRANIMGATKNPLTHIQLTEKTWMVYCSKVWDAVKKSSFFVEYTKLMP